MGDLAKKTEKKTDKKKDTKKDKKSKKIESAALGILPAFMTRSLSATEETKQKKEKKEKKKKNDKKEKSSSKEKKEKKSRKKDGNNEIAWGSPEADNKKYNSATSHLKESGKKHLKANIGKAIAAAKDSIEQHRDGYEAEILRQKKKQDNIEQHREVFEEAQVVKLDDWYEQESLAADLESLRRKPWYQKIKEEDECSPTEAYYSNGHIAPANAYSKGNIAWEQEGGGGLSEACGISCLDTKVSEEEKEASDESEESSSSQEGTAETVDEAYEYALGYQDGVRLGHSTFARPLPLEEDRDRLEYARRSVERMKKIEELRKSREKMKAKMQAKKQKLKNRYERIQKYGTAKRPGRSLRENVSALTEPDQPLLVDLTNVCDDYRGRGDNEDRNHSDREVQPSRFSHWELSSQVKRIPVIVDLSNHRKPQPILDLTNFEEPPIDEDLVTPPKPNRRLIDLRKEREDKLYNMTRKYQGVVNKKVQAATKIKRDRALTTYQSLMDRVTRNVRKTVCY